MIGTQQKRVQVNVMPRKKMPRLPGMKKGGIVLLRRAVPDLVLEYQDGSWIIPPVPIHDFYSQDVRVSVFMCGKGKGSFVMMSGNEPEEAFKNGEPFEGTPLHAREFYELTKRRATIALRAAQGGRSPTGGARRAKRFSFGYGGADQLRFLNRQLSLPVSTISQ